MTTATTTVPVPASTGTALMTPRRIQVLNLVAQGRTAQQIADTLGLSLNTINACLRHIYTALSARDRAHAVALGVIHGYIDLNRVRRADGRTPPTAPPTAPLPGTVRDDIAVLLRAGMSDRAIADAIHVSAKTVARARTILAAAAHAAKFQESAGRTRTSQ